MLDSVDFTILKILQEKARIPNVEVARQVNMAPSAVLERIRKLEKQGIIAGYEVRLNPDSFARNLVTFITVTVQRRQDEARCGAALAALAEAQEVHCVAGDDGMLLKVRVPGPEELGRLIRDKISASRGSVPSARLLCLKPIRKQPVFQLTMVAVESILRHLRNVLFRRSALS
jgi:Lrp/AsnC family leucine-responsive transcriptional regulator